MILKQTEYDMISTLLERSRDAYNKKCGCTEDNRLKISGFLVGMLMLHDETLNNELKATIETFTKNQMVMTNRKSKEKYKYINSKIFIKAYETLKNILDESIIETVGTEEIKQETNETKNNYNKKSSKKKTEENIELTKVEQ